MSKKMKKISSFPTVDVMEYLARKGIEYKEAMNGDWLNLRCLYPDHEDKRPSASIHKIHGGYNCPGCGRTASWKKLLNDLGWEQDETVLVGVTPYALWDRFGKDLNKNLDKIMSYRPIGKVVKILPKNETKPMYDYLKRRKLETSIDMFKMKALIHPECDSDKMYLRRVLIPVHDRKGKFLWYEGRLIRTSKGIKYYRETGTQPNKILFNLHRVIRKKFDYIIIVEGILDAITLWMWGYPGVCTFGAKISLEQMILASEFDKVYILFDNDFAGSKAFGKVKKVIKNIPVEFYRIKYPRKKDVNDNSKEFFEKRFKVAPKIE